MRDEMSRGQGFDELVDQEWGSFRAELGDHLAASRDDRFEIRPAGTGAPLVVVTREAESERFEVMVPGAHDPDWVGAQVDCLAALGFEMTLVLAGFEVSWIKSRVSSPDEAAWVSVQVCRDVYAVPSPAVLDAGELTPPALEEPSAAEPELDPARPIEVTGPDELADAIERALEVVAPGAYERDEHHFTIGHGPGSVMIGPDASRAAVWVVMWPVAVRPTSAAVREVQLVNRDARFGRYYLKEGVLVAEAMLVATPFVPSQLAEVLTGLIKEAEALAEDFAWRTHGKVRCQEWSS